MAGPAGDPGVEDALDILLLDPGGRSTTRGGHAYPIHKLHRLRRRAWGRQLERARIEERERFSALAPRFPDVLRYLLRKFPSPSMDPAWRVFNAGIVQQMVPRPPYAFLRRPPLNPNVYSDAYDAVAAAELEEVVRRLGTMNRSAYDVLRENSVGGPWVYDHRYLTSSALVKHLLHLLLLSTETGMQFSGIRRVIEWGGGYGSLARLFLRFQPDLNYVILDTPVMLAVQWLFLSTILGPHRVVLPGSGDVSMQDGIVRLENADTYQGAEGPTDLFVSTFALSESPRDQIDRVDAGHWFGAEHLWLAYTPMNPCFPQWKTLEAAAVRSSARLVPHPFRRLDRYACR
jgi:hypothetical protein